jgi:SAM-dependent methyltransferase
MNEKRDDDKAARCGEPSYVWRSGQERRLKMICEAAEERLSGIVLENGCGVGMYVEHLAPFSRHLTGLEFDLDRAVDAHRMSLDLANTSIVNAAGEQLPFPDQSFDFILSHEVLEHVNNDRHALEEMVRVLRPKGRIVIFVPNRGYPFETHGIYWRGRYRFGNIPLVNYLPKVWRNRYVPHVRVYSAQDMKKLTGNLPVKIIQQKIIFGAYDNIIARKPTLGRFLRWILHKIEPTPLSILGLSHFWVLEKTDW